MITNELIRQLKQSNISTDPTKTKARTAQLWKSASRAEQSAVLACSGVARPSVHRAYKTGNISAKLVVALAQTRNISPFFLTGQTDTPGECTDEALHELLLQHGYKKLLSAAEAPKPRAKRSDRKAVPPPATPVCCDLTDDELVLLLRAALIRARADEAYAATVEKLKALLLG